MARKFIDQKPDEVLTMCYGYKPLRDANKLLKAYGLAIRWRGHESMGDQVFLRIEEIGDVVSRKPRPPYKHPELDDWMDRDRSITKEP